MILQTKDIADWYILLGKAQADTGHFLPREVEDYLVRLLYSMSKDGKELIVIPGQSDGKHYTDVQKQILLQLIQVAQHNLLLCGLYPEHVKRLGISTDDLILKGSEAYRHIAHILYDSNLYHYLFESFAQLVNILRVVVVLTGIRKSIGLVDAPDWIKEEEEQYPDLNKQAIKVKTLVSNGVLH